MGQKIDLSGGDHKRREGGSYPQTSIQTLNGILLATKINQQQLFSKNFCVFYFNLKKTDLKKTPFTIYEFEYVCSFRMVCNKISERKFHFQ